MSLAYLYDPNKQFIDRNGGANVGGFLRVYLNGTDDHATTYKNFEGTLNAEDIVLDNNGRAVVICEDSQYYRIEVYNRAGALLWTQYPVQPGEVIPNVSIVSPKDTLSIHVTTDAITHEKKFEIDVVEEEKSLGWFSIPSMEYVGVAGMFYADTFDKIQNGNVNPQGDRISFDAETHKVRLKPGVYSIEATANIKWYGEPQNRVISIGGIQFDLSYRHEERFSKGIVRQINAETNLNATFTCDSEPPDELEVVMSEVDVVFVKELDEGHPDEPQGNGGNEETAEEPRRILNKVAYNVDQRVDTSEEEKETARLNIGAARAEDVPQPSDSLPTAPGTADPGTSEEYSRADHVHPYSPAPDATSTVKGVVKLGSDVVQNIEKSEPTRYKHRTYPVQKNADGQMVVNVPWRNDFNNVYKGILILTIEGTCTDEYREATAVTSEHVTTQIVSPYYDDVSAYGYNTYNVVYHEEAGHPADNRPEFHVDNAGMLYFTFEDEHQEALAFHFALSIASKTGYNFIDDTEPVFAEWGHDSTMKQPVMDMVRSLVYKKSDSSNVYPILGNGVNLVSPKTVDLTTTYKIEAVAEYMYTCSPPEFFVFDAVDDQGNNMVNENGDHMVFYEDNPDYVGA